MSPEAPLRIPRRLAIALLAEAQRAEGGAVSGLIGARDGLPVAIFRDPGASGALEAQGQGVWARYRSGATDPDGAPGRQLLISIDTKGVLQLRCWEDGAAGPQPRQLAVGD
jgi:hypothetical protein